MNLFFHFSKIILYFKFIHFLYEIVLQLPFTQCKKSIMETLL